MGMFCGLVYNIALLYWIVIALTRYGGLSSPLALVGLVAVATYMALYPALFCLALSWLVHKRRTEKKWGLMILWGAPVLWVGLDFLRSVLGTGFPWMDLSYGLYLHPVLLQSADLGGHYLITFCIVMINGLLGHVLLARIRGVSKTGGFSLSVVMTCILLAGISGYSLFKYKKINTVMEQADKRVIRVVQGNISQDEKWGKGKKRKTLTTYLELSRGKSSDEHVDLIVWPETALPFYVQQDPLAADIISFVQTEQVALLTGAPSFAAFPGQGEQPEFSFFNSAFLISPQGLLVGRYDKQHLVPFGEYVPLRSMLPFIEPLVVAAGDFTAGRSGKPLQTGKIKSGVLICFEAIFPDIARRETVNGANILVNITNDAWYGRSSAPYQSLAMAVLRAVENRRGLVRAANTGFSGFILPSGDIFVRSQLFVPVAKTYAMPLVDQLTAFSRGGYGFGLLCLLVALLFLLASAVLKKNTTHP